MASKRFKGKGTAYIDEGTTVDGGSPDIAAKVAYLKKAVKIWEKENGKLGRFL